MMEGSLQERFRALLKRHDISQNALAKKAGVSQGAVAAIATGRTEQPEPQTIEALAPVLGMTGTELSVALGLMRGPDEGIDKRKEIVAQFLRENPDIEDYILDIVGSADWQGRSTADLRETLRLAKVIQREKNEMRQGRTVNG